MLEKRIRSFFDADDDDNESNQEEILLMRSCFERSQVEIALFPPLFSGFPSFVVEEAEDDEPEDDSENNILQLSGT